MPWTDAFGPAEALYRAQVMHDTWGHLAPVLCRKYECVITFAVSEYGREALIISDRVGDLDGSPWLFEHLHEIVNQTIEEEALGAGVYRYVGWYACLRGGGWRTFGHVNVLMEVV